MHRKIQNAPLPDIHKPYHAVIADESVLYEGYDFEAVREIFLSAARRGARSIAHFVNGVQHMSSRSML